MTNLIVWGIESNRIKERPEISLVYYPSEYDFIWFAARTLRLLESN